LPEDAQAIANIYNSYVLESVATFELIQVDAATIAERMSGSPTCLKWLVIEGSAGQVIGYARVAPWKPSGVYAHTVDSIAGSTSGIGRRSPLARSDRDKAGTGPIF